MRFQKTTARSYFFGLFVVLGIGILIYLLASAIKLANLSLFSGIIIGVFIGHYVGTFYVFPKSNKKTHSKHSSSKGKGDIITLYVGNLAFSTSRQELQALFSKYGKVYSSRVMTDKITRKPKGYGFIEMEAKNAKSAIEALNGAEFSGRTIKVNEANEKSSRPNR